MERNSSASDVERVLPTQVAPCVPQAMGLARTLPTHHRARPANPVNEVDGGNVSLLSSRTPDLCELQPADIVVLVRKPNDLTNHSDRLREAIL